MNVTKITIFSYFGLFQKNNRDKVNAFFGTLSRGFKEQPQHLRAGGGSVR
jgi:hypothetical protein